MTRKFVQWTDVGGGPETPEPDEISGGSTHDVYSDVMGGLLSLQHVQQPHRDSESLVGSSLPTSAVLAELLPGHSRNSSGTSHSGSGSASGYGSLASQSQHSRQSSSGELGHFRLVLSRHCLVFFCIFLLHISFLPFHFFCSLKKKLREFFCLCFFFCFFFFCLGFFVVVHLSILIRTIVDFRPGQSGRHASPSCVYLSAVALATILSPLWHRPSCSCRPTGLLPTLLPHLPALAAAVALALAVMYRKRRRWWRSVAIRTTVTIKRVHCPDHTVVGSPSVRWPLDGNSRSV